MSNILLLLSRFQCLTKKNKLKSLSNSKFEREWLMYLEEAKRREILVKIIIRNNDYSTFNDLQKAFILPALRTPEKLINTKWNIGVNNRQYLLMITDKVCISIVESIES